jgi:outer membrane protein TolC
MALLVIGVDSGAAQDAEPMPLRRAMLEALSTSRVVADAEYAVQIARQQVREAWASALPEIGGSLTYQRNLIVQEIALPAEFFGGTPGEVVLVRVGTDNTWQLGLNATQPLFEYGVLVGIGAASRYRALEEERLRGTTQEVVTAVRQSYFDALLAESELRLLEQSIERVQQTLEETRALYRAGLTSEYDVLRLEVEFANVSTNLQRARNAVAARKRTLLVEIGYDPDEVITLEGRLDDVEPDSLAGNTPENIDLVVLAGVPEVLAQTLETLLLVTEEQRTDLRQLRVNGLLEEARLNLERGEFVPRLSLFGNYNYTVQDDGGINFFGDANSYSTQSSAVGIRLDVPIFQGFRRFARVEQSQALIRQNETRLVRAEQAAANEVRTVFESVSESLERARSQRRAVDQAERGFEIASVEYREGIGSQLQVTDAEEALRQAQFNYARSVYDFLSARARLELAIGMVPDQPEDFPVPTDATEAQEP